MEAHLTGIHVYPVKGLQGVSVSASEVEPRGLAFDRRWMVVDENGHFLAQRHLPRLSQVRASCTDAGLVISAPGMSDLQVVYPGADADRLLVTIWGDTVKAGGTPPVATEWISAAAGRPCRLVYMPDTSTRPVDPAYDPGDAMVSFADGYPLLLTSMQSLADLNARMAQPVPMLRFRPNVVVDGFPAFSEDSWSEIQIGAVRFHVVKSCTRCVVTTIDLNTGHPGKEPLRTLSTFRKREGKVYFGENLIPQGRGTLRIGDPVKVLSWRVPEKRLF